MARLVRTAVVACVIAAAPSSAGAQSSARDLKRLSIEELAEIDVTSVSRRSERLAGTAAAVSIVRAEDIVRSGATTLADAMRLADGLDVARADARMWAISARGFTITTANKLLVLMDGRTVYSPLFAGTFWDVQDAFLPDVARIEAFRGPAGSIWGANAVNGVVNVIMKDAAETQGAAGLLAAGTSERAVAAARYGGATRGGGSYRVYGKYRHRTPQRLASGASAEDDVDFGQGGFRVESSPGLDGRWFVQGDVYRGSEGQFGQRDTRVAGGNLLARWTRAVGRTGEFRGQASYDRTLRTVPSQFDETRDTVEVDTQQRVRFARRHDLVAGGAFRLTHAKVLGTPALFFDPDERTDAVIGAFAQDEIALQPGRTYLILGSKFERNDLTGFEVQPTARIRWSPSDRATVWAAASRAVRLPTRVETDIRVRNPALFLVGNDDFDSEKVVAWEAGYRAVPHRRFSIDAAAFVNRYDDLRSRESPVVSGDPVVLANSLNALTSGIEVSTALQAAPRLQLRGAYTYFYKDLSFDPGSRDVTGGVGEGNDPSHRFSLRSLFDLTDRVSIDGFFRFVGRRPQPVVPAYAELDVRIGLAVRPGWEISLVGQNLLHDRHPEFGSPTPARTEFTRGAFVRSLWRF